MEQPDRITGLDMLADDPQLDEKRMRIRMGVVVVVLLLVFVATIVIDVLNNVEGVLG